MKYLKIGNWSSITQAITCFVVKKRTFAYKNSNEPPCVQQIGDMVYPSFPKKIRKKINYFT